MRTLCNYILGYNDTEEHGIYYGDAKFLGSFVPNESIDLIICDPVYSNIEDYKWLAVLAARVLVEGGSVIAQAGSEYRYRAETTMYQVKTLIPRPLIAEVYPGATAQMWKHKTFTGWKPHIWMTKGERAGRWLFDRFYGSGRSKKHHIWGDDTAMLEQIIQRLVPEDGIVLDPFTGGGTVPAVCRQLDRHYLAFETDIDTVSIARRRVVETQVPLFIPEPEQQEMVL